MNGNGFYKFTGEFVSSDEKRKVSYFIYEPKCEIKGIVQISHGMCEYIERYEDFADFMTSNGWIVCGNDHLGHGISAMERGELGYFSESHGWKHCVRDLYAMRQLMRQKYSDVPYVLLGHSMGSFIARAFLAKYRNAVDGAVIVGTSAGNPRLTGTQLVLVDRIKNKSEEHSPCEKLNDIVFGIYNNKIDSPESVHDWICSDPGIVEKYDDDELCNFVFTANGFENLIKVLGYVSDDRWYESINKETPILLLAGREDPVVSYGKGVYKVFEKLCENGCNTRVKLYSKMRHEILNEIGKEEVYEDVLGFCGQL